MRMVAVVLGGGMGQRIGAPLPKQLLKLGGRTLLEHCVAAFERAPGVDEILVVMAGGYVEQVRAMVAVPAIQVERRPAVPAWRDADPDVITSYAIAFADYWTRVSRQPLRPECRTSAPRSWRRSGSPGTRPGSTRPPGKSSATCSARAARTTSSNWRCAWEWPEPTPQGRG